jgi:predicted Zn finger-like uncharacterized protein
MIVTCPQCQTRFRIPDERVTAKGVKVRCTRCRHTFRVSRPAEPVETAADPFAQFSPPDALSEADKTPARGISVAAALGVEVEPAGPPPADDFDVDVETTETKRREPPPWSFPPAPPPPPTPDLPSVAATPPPPVEPPFDIPEEPTPRIALARIAMVRQLTVVPPPPPPTPPSPPPAPVEERAAEVDDFEGPPDERLELDSGAHQSAWQGSIEDGLELPPAPASAEFDFGDLNLDAAPVPVSQPSYTPPPPPPPPAARASTTPTPAPARAVGHLDFDAIDSPPAPSPVRPAPPPTADFSFGDLDLAPTPEPRTEPALDLSDLPAPSTTPVPASGTRTPTGELFGKSATRLDEESFPVDNTAADRAALFDMPAPVAPNSEASTGPTSLLADVPDAIPDAPAHPAAGLPAVPATPVGRVSRPPTGTSVLGLDERRERGTALRLSGTVGNIGVAAVLVLVLAAVGNVYVNEGRLDWAALSPRRWAALFVPPSGIVTLDVTNGLYETRGGRPLAYVRGRVENRGQRPGQVKVRAEIWDGSQLLGSSEGLAGVLPTPEEMVEASTRRDVEALRARLQQGAPAVPAGKGTDFVLLFDEPPAEVAGLRLKVTAAAADGR